MTDTSITLSADQQARLAPGHTSDGKVTVNWDTPALPGWAELETAIPTINGYSGSTPPGWLPLYSSSVSSDADRERVRQALHQWAAAHSIAPDKIAWIVDDEHAAPQRP